MKGIPFPEANSKAGLAILTTANTEPLPVYTDGHACVSVWELDDEDIQEIIKTRKLQLLVCTKPSKHPIVAVSAFNILPKTPNIIIP